ncbi:hypothetical protein GCM10027195_43540 [Comamonas sediminis]
MGLHIPSKQHGRRLANGKINAGGQRQCAHAKAVGQHDGVCHQLLPVHDDRSDPVAGHFNGICRPVAHACAQVQSAGPQLACQ